MNSVQFDALSRLLRLREGPARNAARLILVEKQSVNNAARLAGCSNQSASNTHQRCLAGLRLIRNIVTDETEVM